MVDDNLWIIICFFQVGAKTLVYGEVGLNVSPHQPNCPGVKFPSVMRLIPIHQNPKRCFMPSSLSSSLHYFPSILNSCHHGYGSWYGRGGVLVDMNSCSPRHILVVVVMEAGSAQHTWCTQGVYCRKQLVTFWLINELLNLMMKSALAKCCLFPQVTSSMTSLTWWRTRSWVSPGSFSFITWW